jgi:hypothetical protein
MHMISCRSLRRLKLQALHFQIFLECVILLLHHRTDLVISASLHKKTNIIQEIRKRIRLDVHGV